MTRRELLIAPLAASAGAEQHPSFVKSICSVIFPDNTPYVECFARARNAGFDAMEVSIGRDLPLEISRDDAQRMRDAAQKAAVQIATVWVSEPLRASPLNSDDAAVRARGVEAIRKAIGIATNLNCGALLLYAVRLGNGAKLQYGSQDTWDRYTVELRKAIPDAERARVLLNPENVWNKFLLSPLEMRAFVDQFRSPWVQTHFDTGNVMQYGYPEDWILTLGPRIRRIHFKDYKLANRTAQGRFVDLLEGDVNWSGVMAALVKVGYRGFISPEIGYDAGQPDQLKRVSAAGIGSRSVRPPECVQYRLPADRIHPEHNSMLLVAADARSAAEIACQIPDQACFGIPSVCSPCEAVQHRLRAVRIQLEHYSGPPCAEARTSSAIEIACRVSEQTCGWPPPVHPCEAVQHRFAAFIQLENCSEVRCAAEVGSTVEIACRVSDQTSPGEPSVHICEAVQ